MEKKTRRLIGLGFCVAAGLSGCGQDAPESGPRIRPVRYQEVEVSGAVRVRTFSGTSQASQETDLSFRVGGVVERIAVEVGNRVEAGTEIAALDPRDYQLTVGQSEAQLSREEANLRSASADFDRTKALYENKNASLADMDAARARFESAEATVRAARQALELARSHLTYTRLRAPVDGSIAVVRVEENENVRAGQVVAILASGSYPEVQVSIPEALITQIREGSATRVTFSAIPGGDFQATVTEVGVTTSGGRTTFPVTVRLDEASEQIRSGMAAEVAFSLSSPGAEYSIVVPAVAVGEDDAGRFVFIVEDVEGEVGTAYRRTVRVGELGTSGMEIVEGLEAGDLLVVRGINRLADGTPVRLLPGR